MRRGRLPMQRFFRNRRGATAVEFALVAAPFFFGMFAIIELGLVFVLSSVLDNATLQAGRLVRTGQMQAGDAATYKTAVCNRMSIFSGDCNARLTIDVRVVPRFDNPNLPDPFRTTGGTTTFDPSAMGYQNSQARDIVVVRSWWRQPLFTPLMSQGLSKLGDGQAILSSTDAFRNEPW
ncbi:pilus assembly protein [Brevundimonas sp. 2R-24]|uniref:Pilus assembly protein n=1 Tax=Peiella sedimenti TaxID=3061083 RepID=A0ABT8SMB0_9CAUL|nr:pilus assembly protein [Caulobacteraceae bacterium XZ-24]